MTRLVNILSAAALPGLLIILILAAVETLVRLGLTSPWVMAAPTQVAVKLVTAASYFAGHFGITLLEVVGGFALSVVVAVPLAAAMAGWTTARRALLPLVVLTQVLPKMAVVPLILLIFGLAPPSKIVIAFVIAFFPIVINTFVGLIAVEPEKLYVVTAMGATPLQIFRKVRLVAALPSMFAGFKLAATLCVVGAIVGEILGPYKGLGWIVKIGNYTHNMPLFWGAMVLLVVMGLGAFLAIQVLERISIPWHVSQRERR